MKWIYGKQDWSTRERGQENCFLMTNYLGGFSSATMIGSAARGDHALLMACTKAPNHRYNMLHRLSERVGFEEEACWISSQEFADGHWEEGYLYLSGFTYEDTPVWRFQVRGMEIRKEIGMKRGANAIGIRYEICNRGSEAGRLVVTPFFQFTPKGVEPEKTQKFIFSEGAVSSNNMTLYFRTNGQVTEIPEKEETYFYRYDACDGRRKYGRVKANHEISCEIKPQETRTLEIVYEMEQTADTAEEIISDLKKYRAGLEQKAGFRSACARMLSKSADQFIAKRESTGGDTILAGFPFFEDWGRDTMIALPGLCILTGQYETAKKILRTFAVNERDGLMPNLFPEGGNEPMYNTADAALLFINCVWLYYEATGDESFVRGLYPVMRHIIEGYRSGTAFGIHMDADGLIMAGEGLQQVTWMDVRAGDVLPTPRHGKPVEINAYWYNALCIMERLKAVVEKKGEAGCNGKQQAADKCKEALSDMQYGVLAERVRRSFAEKFWLEDAGYLRDVISGTHADRQFRCNQIWAVSMPFTMLDGEKEKKIVDRVYEKLYTPYGLRTLAEDDPEFHPYYRGSMFERDMAYHQGTVWTYPLGSYYLAWLKVHDYSEAAKHRVCEQLEVLESALREGCIGQLPEIYDGGNPGASRGCFAQAWSVGELLRVYAAIEKEKNDA